MKGEKGRRTFAIIKLKKQIFRTGTSVRPEYISPCIVVHFFGTRSLTAFIAGLYHVVVAVVVPVLEVYYMNLFRMGGFASGSAARMRIFEKPEFNLALDSGKDGARKTRRTRARRADEFFFDHTESGLSTFT